MSKMEKNIIGEVNRINELMMKNSSSKELLLEQVKAVDDVMHELIDPAMVKKQLKRFGMSIEVPVEKFQKNFSTLIDMVGEKSTRAWDDMIAEGVDVRIASDILNPDGTPVPWKEIKDLSLEQIQEIVESGEWVEVQSFQKSIGDLQWVHITKEVYEEILTTNELYNSLPHYLRFPASQLTRRLKDTFGDGTSGIRSVEDLMRNLQLFFKDGTITSDLSRAIIKLMSNDPKFAKTFAEMLVNKVRFKNQLKLNRFTDTLDDFYTALAKDLDLPMDGVMMKKLMAQLDEASENLGKWFEFLWMKTKPLKLIQDMYFGVAFKNWKTGAKTIFVDIFASGFWNWVMGIGFLKPMFRKLAAVYGTGKISKLWSIDMVGRWILQMVGFYIMIGFVSGLKNMDIKKGYAWPWFLSKVNDIIGTCTGKDKPHDALTGQFFANASTVTTNEDGDIIATCKGAELQPEFINQFKLSPDEVIIKAEAIYAALNGKAHGSSPWNMELGIPLTDIEIPFVEGKEIPSITQIFLNYLEYYEIDRSTFNTMFFDVKVGDNGMDIFKMSQVANYYEKTFSASLINDVKNLDNWSKTLGRELLSHADFIVALNKMPYLNLGKLDQIYKTFNEIVTENAKHILAYPKFVKALDDVGFETTIFLNKCCETDCGCPTGCNIGGKFVESDMGVALNEKLNIKNQADWEGKTFDEIKKVFDAVYSVSSSNKCYLNPSPRGAATEADTWDCEEVSGYSKCVKKTDGSGQYNALVLCQQICNDDE